MDLRKVFDCMISVSELGRGQASKVIQTVEETGNPYIVVKNNKPQAVIMSINAYIELMRAKDIVDSMKISPQVNSFPSFGPHNFTESNRSHSLTEDEINIFLNDEKND